MAHLTSRVQLPDSTQKQEHPLSGSPDVVDDVPEEAFPLTECMESRVEEQTDCFALSEVGCANFGNAY